MLRRCNKLRGYRLHALDGDIGKVEDFYFDDQSWAVRYLVADTGYWLADRLVLISPHVLKHADEDENLVHVELTRQQIEGSPPITADQPVSRQFERDYYRYYGWPEYWMGPALWGPGPFPLFDLRLENAQSEDQPAEGGDPRLRSVQEVTGYHLQSKDGEIGHVEDVIVEDRSWAARYFVVDTGNWLPRKRILLAPQWISHLSWERSAVAVDLSRARIESAPAYDPHSVVGRDYEVSLFKHYSREGYWHEEGADNQHAA